MARKWSFSRWRERRRLAKEAERRGPAEPDLIEESEPVTTVLEEAATSSLAQSVEPTSDSPSSEKSEFVETEPEFEVPDIDSDEDDLETTSVRTDYDDSLSETQRVAARLLKVMHEKTYPENIDESSTGLVMIEVIGKLADGNYAWTSEAGQWGVIRPNDFKNWSIEAGDKVRANITSRAWLHVIEGVALPTLVRRTIGRVQPAPSVKSPERTNTFVDDLIPGDVVVAHVPFGPNAPVDREGRTGKLRPVIFVGWTGQFIRVRGVYTAEKGRYIVRNGGIRLMHTAGIFSKENVAVKPTIVELSPGNLRRRIGRLHEQDLGRIGLGGYRPLLPAVEVRPQFPAPSRASAHSMGTVDPVLREFAFELLDQCRGLAEDSWGSALSFICRQFVDGKVPIVDPTRPGISLVSIGSLLKVLEMELGWRARPKPLAGYMSESLESGLLSGVFVISSHTRAEDVRLATQIPPGFQKYARPGAAGPSASPTSVVEMVSPVTFGDYDEESTDDVPVTLVVLDQEWTASILGGDRLDLLRLRSELCGESGARAVLIGSNHGGLDLLHRAAIDRGWEVFPVGTRREFLATAIEISRTTHLGRALLISARADVLIELENLGWDVENFVDLDRFLY